MPGLRVRAAAASGAALARVRRPCHGDALAGDPHPAELGPDALAPAGQLGLAAAGVGRHGERSRSQVLLKLAGAENVLILAVNVLAVNGPLHALYSVKKCLIHSI